MAYYKKKNSFHFRHHKKSKHNALIVGEDKKNYDYIKVTSSPKKDKTHSNNIFKKNPKIKNNEKSYYENRIRIDVKDNFNNKSLKSWNLSYEDYEDIVKLIKRKKK